MEIKNTTNTNVATFQLINYVANKEVLALSSIIIKQQ